MRWKENLWVEFTTGRRYVYRGVPHEVADAFRGAFSKGVYFNTRISDHFPHREVGMPTPKQRNLKPDRRQSVACSRSA